MSVEKNKIDHKPGNDVLVLFSALIKSRVFTDFWFYKLMQDLESFENIWCCKQVLCTIVESELHFEQSF